MYVCVCVLTCTHVSTRAVVRKKRGNAFQGEAGVILRNCVSTGAEPQNGGREWGERGRMKTANLREAKMWSKHFTVFLSRGMTWAEMWVLFVCLFNHSDSGRVSGTEEADTTGKGCFGG